MPHCAHEKQKTLSSPSFNSSENVSNPRSSSSDEALFQLPLRRGDFDAAAGTQLLEGGGRGPSHRRAFVCKRLGERVGMRRTRGAEPSEGLGRLPSHIVIVMIQQ